MSNGVTRAGACIRCVRLALLVSEILCFILGCIRRSNLTWDHTPGKRTLASLARTCHTTRQVGPPRVLPNRAFSGGSRLKCSWARGGGQLFTNTHWRCASPAKPSDGGWTSVSCITVRSESQPVTDTLSIKLDKLSMALYTSRFPSHVHTWWLAGGNSAALRLCLHYLATIQGSSGTPIRPEIGSISCNFFLSHVVLILLIRFVGYTRIPISSSVVLWPGSLLKPKRSRQLSHT